MSEEYHLALENYTGTFVFKHPKVWNAVLTYIELFAPISNYFKIGRIQFKIGRI